MLLEIHGNAVDPKRHIDPIDVDEWVTEHATIQSVEDKLGHDPHEQNQHRELGQSKKQCTIVAPTHCKEHSHDEGDTHEGVSMWHEEHSDTTP